MVRLSSAGEEKLCEQRKICVAILRSYRRPTNQTSQINHDLPGKGPKEGDAEEKELGSMKAAIPSHDDKLLLQLK